MIVCKFGGTSMATAASMLRVADIIRTNSSRQMVVVSGPGKTNQHAKVTDMMEQRQWVEAFNRFAEIINELKLGPVTHDYLHTQYWRLVLNGQLNERGVFGEHMSAYLLARMLGWYFVDAVDVFHFIDEGVHVTIPHGRLPFVVPGYYGYDVRTASIRLFPRGGSDISGAYLAAASGAGLYENWTDVSGVYDQDPCMHSNAHKYDRLTYGQLQKKNLQVFHPDAVAPLYEASVQMVIKNTFDPSASGTIVERPSV